MKTLETGPQLPPQPSLTDITIQLDGQPHRVPADTSLAVLVAQLGHEAQAVSTAVNGEFVPRDSRDRQLIDGDTVLLFQPIVGG